MVCQRIQRRQERRFLGKLNCPNWLAAYAWRLVKITGWGYREIIEDVPFAVGLQMIHAEDYSRGNARKWRVDSAPSFDAAALIEEAFQKAKA